MKLGPPRNRFPHAPHSPRFSSDAYIGLRRNIQSPDGITCAVLLGAASVACMDKSERANVDHGGDA